VLSAAATSYAQSPTPPAGAGALSRARVAWQKGDFDLAEPLYKQAIDAGGLPPEDIVDAWAHLGAARAVMGQMKPAAEAFRQACVIDPKFVVPPEAGKRAVQLGEAVRRQNARVGPIAFQMSDPPASVKAGQAFGIDATLDSKHVPYVAKIGILARDPLTQKTFADSKTADTSVHFDVPGKIALPGATIVIRVDALDAHDNRLATAEKRIQVDGAIAKGEPPPPRKSDDEPKEQKKEGGGFWSSPWPYVIGGVVLAGAGGAAFYFTRQTDDVSVGSPRLVR